MILSPILIESRSLRFQHRVFGRAVVCVRLCSGTLSICRFSQGIPAKSSRKSVRHIGIMEQIYAPNISINSSVSFCEQHFHFSSSYTMIEENMCENGCCCCSPINTTLLRVSFDEAPLSRGRGCRCAVFSFLFAPFVFFLVVRTSRVSIMSHASIMENIINFNSRILWWTQLINLKTWFAWIRIYIHKWLRSVELYLF